MFTMGTKPSIEYNKEENDCNYTSELISIVGSLLIKKREPKLKFATLKLETANPN